VSEKGRRDVVRDTTKLKAVHRKRVLRDGEAKGPPAFDRTRYPEKILVAARAGWQGLLDSEFESVVIAGWMTSALARMGAPLDILGAFGRIVEDEVRHVDLCAEVMWALGGKPTISELPPPPYPGWQDDPAAEDEALAGLASFFCVGELCSNFLLRQAEMLASEPIATWALGEIVRDEAFHGPWGYETIRPFLAGWAAPRKAKLVKRLLEECARLEKRLGGPLGPYTGEKPLTKAQEQLAALGLPGPAPLLAVYYQAIETQLLPRMKDIGIDLPLAVGANAGG
jgi:hypothetical protein